MDVHRPIPLPLISRQIPQKHPFSKTVAETSCLTVDDHALKPSAGATEGGFPYGLISSISGANGSGKTLIATHVIISHLLANPESHVAWVDTSGTFSVHRLLRVAADRVRALEAAAKAADESFTPSQDDVVQRKANELLDRVQVTKAFDLHGVADVINEIKRTMDDLEAERVEKERLERKKRIVRSSVDGSEDEMLEDEEEEGNALDQEVGISGRVGVVVVDTVSHVTDLAAVKGPVQANALLNTFSRAATLLAKNWFTAVLLLNNTPLAPPQRFPQSNRNYQPAQSTSASVFAAIKQSTGLGPVLNSSVDLKVMLSYFEGPQEPGAPTNYKKLQLSKPDPIIFEVVTDRHGCRTGKWAIFEIKDGHEIMDFTWPEKQREKLQMRSNLTES